MVTADEYTTPAPPDVAWEADESCLRCTVGWPGDRPPLAQVLPLFEHLGLVLTDHRPEEAADSFVFSRVEDADLDELLPLLAAAFTARLRQVPPGVLLESVGWWGLGGSGR